MPDKLVERPSSRVSAAAATAAAPATDPVVLAHPASPCDSDGVSTPPLAQPHPDRAARPRWVTALLLALGLLWIVLFLLPPRDDFTQGTLVERSSAVGRAVVMLWTLSLALPLRWFLAGSAVLLVAGTGLCATAVATGEWRWMMLGFVVFPAGYLVLGLRGHTHPRERRPMSPPSPPGRP